MTIYQLESTSTKYSQELAQKSDKAYVKAKKEHESLLLIQTLLDALKSMGLLVDGMKIHASDLYGAVGFGRIHFVSAENAFRWARRLHENFGILELFKQRQGNTIKMATWNGFSQREKDSESTIFPIGFVRYVSRISDYHGNSENYFQVNANIFGSEWRFLLSFALPENHHARISRTAKRDGSYKFDYEHVTGSSCILTGYGSDRQAVYTWDGLHPESDSIGWLEYFRENILPEFEFDFKWGNNG